MKYRRLIDLSWFRTLAVLAVLGACSLQLKNTSTAENATTPVYLVAALGLGAYPARPATPAYRAQPAHKARPARPATPAYRGRNAYPASPAYRSRTAPPAQPAYPAR